MINASLDLTLVYKDPEKTEAIKRAREVFKQLKEIPSKLEDFIDLMVEKAQASREFMEDFFWELLTNGGISLSSDFQLKLILA